LVKAAPGVELTRADHVKMMIDYALPDGSGRSIELSQYILPDDLVVREVALASVCETGACIDAIRRRAGIEGADYPSSLGVAALFSSILKVWRSSSSRTVADAVLDRVEAKVAAVIDKLLFKHDTLNVVHEALRSVGDGGEGQAILPLLQKEAAVPYVHLGLRMAAEYGDPLEVVSAAKLALLVERRGWKSWILQDSLRYALHRTMDGALHRQLRECVEAFDSCERPLVQQYAPKLIPLRLRERAGVGAQTA
jgi:hypothetical protein